ncbi:MAG: inositol monophosphatase [Candidatus Aenigmarchaeota archaeon]|nr:inositol monophosphatase [Candidatus Aenigmarchaeota archaeon]
MPIVEERESSTLDDIAQEAGGLLLSLYNTELELLQKGEHDFATNADIQSERLIITRLKEANLPYVIVAEEKLEDMEFPLRLGNSGILYVDPLEGTHNFARKRKEFGFGVTLGLVKNGRPVYVVFYNPVTKELYRAIKEGGAYLNGERIHVSDRRENLDIIFNHWPDRKYAGRYLDVLRRITDYTPTSASDAVDIWMVARGSADGLVYIFREADMHDLISALGIEEAGGRVTNGRGSQWFTVVRNGFVKVKNSMIAGNPYVHNLLLQNYI